LLDQHNKPSLAVATHKASPAIFIFPTLPTDVVYVQTVLNLHVEASEKLK